MTRGLKITSWVLVGLLVVIVGLVVLIATFDWNDLKPTINDRVSTALERPFAIQGDLSVDWQRHRQEEGWRSWVPWPYIQAEDIVLGNPDYIEEKNFARVARVEAPLSLVGLLSKRIIVPSIELTEPAINLIRLEDGRNNWTFGAGGDDASSSQPSSDQTAWQPRIDQLIFDQGQLHYRDETLGADIDATIDPLGQPIPIAAIISQDDPREFDAQRPDYAFSWMANGQYRGQPIDGEGKLGGVLALQDAQRPFPLEAQLNSGSSHIAVSGVLHDPLNAGGLDLNLRFSGESLDNLYSLTGITLPATPPYSTEGHLTAELNRPEGPRYRYENFDGQIGESDIHGTLTYTVEEPRPRLEGELVTQQLRFRDLAPLIGADSNQRKEARGEETRQPPGKVLPVEEFNTQRWNTMDADVRFVAERIEHGESLPLSDLNTHLTLENGELLLDPLSFAIASGTINSTLRLQGQYTPMRGRIDMHARRLLLKELMPELETMRDALGEINGDATLSGSGNSVAALLGSSDGELSTLVNDGSVSRNLMELLGLNVGNYLVGRLFGDEQVQINCAAANLAFNDGIATSQLFMFDTENALINVTGTIDFANEQLDLTIEPESKGARIFTLRSPLYVRGTFADPSPGVEVGPLAARGAVAAALGAIAPPAALLALASPSEGEEAPCTSFLHQIDAEQQ